MGSYTRNSGGGTPSRSYEISNYLGNVMATIGDGQIPRMNGSLIDYYDADIQTATDYYSYGMVMPGRSFNAGSYRYGFNGQEMSNEIKGVGNSYTAEFWEYDPRLGRRWNLDPRPNVSISPYATLSNNPIWFNDIKGDTTYKFNSGGIFLGMDDLDVTGVVGSIGNYKARRDANGKKFQSWESSVNFTFNDLSIDREQLNSLEVGQKGITIVSDENINWVMSKSDIKRKSMLSRWYFAASESVTEKMDFNLSYTLPSQGVEPQGGGDVKSVEGLGGFMLFENHHTAFNLNDAGQFLWGQAMNRLGFDYSNAKIGSQSFARTFEFAWDTSADQKAIREGFHYKPKLQTAASAGPFEGLPKQEWRRSNKGEKKTKNN